MLNFFKQTSRQRSTHGSQDSIQRNGVTRRISTLKAFQGLEHRVGSLMQMHCSIALIVAGPAVSCVKQRVTELVQLSH
ncbi:MAG: hypothetical protein EBU46_00340 [Nitrosomonadaceae bacterium]|nr:hypothetical protein [Nitrosomonadaceae bacterium]